MEIDLSKTFTSETELTSIEVNNPNPQSVPFDVAEMLEEAYERAGLVLRGGYQARTAMRSINMIASEWANKGLNLWSIESGYVSLQKGIGSYVLPSDTIDLIEHVIRGPDGIDYAIPRNSIKEFANLPNKYNTNGRPSQIYIERSVPFRVRLWPVPEKQGFRLVYWRMAMTYGFDKVRGIRQLPSIPQRFVPAFVAGMSYHICLKSTDDKAFARLPMLKSMYDEELSLALSEDRDRSYVSFTTDLSGYER